jgi:hypothetical protein
MITRAFRQRLLSRLLLATASALIGACGNVVDLELHAQSICVASISQSFPGVPAGFPASKPIPLNFSAPLQQLPATGDLKMEVRFQDITLSSGNGDLGFVDRVSVDLNPSSQKPGLSAFTLAEYTRSAAGTATEARTITLQAADTRDVSDYLADEPAQLKFTVHATLPNSPVTLDVEGCVGATARLQY